MTPIEIELSEENARLKEEMAVLRAGHKYAFEQARLNDAALIKGLKKQNADLLAAAKALQDLISDSGGVYGLHLNGDMAPWDSLLAGGKYEEWLVAHSRVADTALAALMY